MEVNKLNGSIEVTSFELNYNIDGEETVEIALKGRGEVFKPKNNDNKSVLLKVTTEAKAPEDKFLVRIIANVKYEFGKAIDDYDNYIADVCVPDAINNVYKVMDDAMVALGRSPLNLSMKNHDK